MLYLTFAIPEKKARLIAGVGLALLIISLLLVGLALVIGGPWLLSYAAQVYHPTLYLSRLRIYR